MVSVECLTKDRVTSVPSAAVGSHKKHTPKICMYHDAVEPLNRLYGIHTLFPDRVDEFRTTAVNQILTAHRSWLVRVCSQAFAHSVCRFTVSVTSEFREAHALPLYRRILSSARSLEDRQALGSAKEY